MLDERDIQIIKEIIQESEARLEARMDARMEARIAASESRIIAYIESDILPKFDILAEGHQVLRETLAPNTRVEKVEEEVAFIKPLVLSNTRDIVELKKAQCSFDFK